VLPYVRRVLPGYENDQRTNGAIEITYDMQERTYTDPVTRVTLPLEDKCRVAYPPNNGIGRRVLALLKRAWVANLTFVVDKASRMQLSYCRR
jgi:hypothetical protein